ncbi:uncharacterized protein BYT42DRAFT_573755 [Radiomyces spectabilis]|uniref:uncharacterized protein n=1 Tax=Radiomyces spectabilis TaxID=64574 RepID=UPI00221EC83C|nr:uncharacterized protein BYT42DRAFT_573755 [Radiomyces spectabilis]KAI8376204.1 hypothetical protein BYT42DRAFT_573755 [Radiomyces spectabilis]
MLRSLPRCRLNTPLIRCLRYYDKPVQRISTPYTRNLLLRSPPSRYLIISRYYSTTNESGSTSAKGKIKGFMKKYGAVGLGVYLALSAVDLSLTMAVISVKGADRVKQMEDWVFYKVKSWIGLEHKPFEPGTTAEKPSFTSLFVIAYGIHKTLLLPFRLSLTAAITPALVKRLRKLGWIHKTNNK